MNRKINLLISIIVSLTYVILFNITSFAQSCNDIRNNTIRLHIIAQSDDEKDQLIKYQIRDSILKKYSDVFKEVTNIQDAEEKLISEKDSIQQFVNRKLSEYGVKYSAEITVEKEYFNTRKYENGIILPAGEYLALKINLGESKGENWWCIIFPALCLPAADINSNTIENVYSDQSEKIIKSSQRYEIRFKIIEYIEKTKQLVDKQHQG